MRTCTCSAFAVVWEGPDVILTGRKILGATNPNAADIGTLRGDFCLRTVREQQNERV
jgi:nucleoside diphosphate kinase